MTENLDKILSTSITEGLTKLAHLTNLNIAFKHHHEFYEMRAKEKRTAVDYHLAGKTHKEYLTDELTHWKDYSQKLISYYESQPLC